MAACAWPRAGPSCGLLRAYAPDPTSNDHHYTDRNHWVGQRHYTYTKDRKSPKGLFRPAERLVLFTGSVRRHIIKYIAIQIVWAQICGRHPPRSRAIHRHPRRALRQANAGKEASLNPLSTKNSGRNPLQYLSILLLVSILHFKRRFQVIGVPNRKCARNGLLLAAVRSCR